MNEESAPSGPTRLPTLDPEMRSAIARRLLFCRAYRQLKQSLKPRHNQVADRYAVQAQAVDANTARLKSLRLAKEAADKDVAAQAKAGTQAKTKPAAANKKPSP